MMNAVDKTAAALLTSTTILTVGNVVDKLSRLGGRTVTGITPEQRQTHQVRWTNSDRITPEQRQTQQVRRTNGDGNHT